MAGVATGPSVAVGIVNATPVGQAIGVASTIWNAVSGLFGHSQTDANGKVAVQGWLNTLTADPSLTTAAGQHAMLWLRCFSGDNSVWNEYKRLSGDPSSNPPGCGCGTLECRQAGQAVLSQLVTQLTTATVVGQQAAAGLAAINGNTQPPADPSQGTSIVPSDAGPAGTIIVPVLGVVKKGTLVILLLGALAVWAFLRATGKK